MKKPPRRLGKIRGLLSLMLALNVLTLIGAALSRVTGGVDTNFTVPPQAVYGPQPYTLQQVNKHLWPLSIEVYIREPTVAQIVLGLFAHGLAIVLATIPMIIYARRLVDRAVATQPFTVETARGLRRLGLLVLTGGLLAEVVRSAAAVLLYNSTVHDGAALFYVDWHIDLWWLLLGLVIMAFAQVVEHGCALRAELDEVI